MQKGTAYVGSFSTIKKHFLVYRMGNYDDFLLSCQRLNLHSITYSAKHSNITHHRARLRCFSLLHVIYRPKVTHIYFPGRTILPEAFIPSNKYFLKNLTFVVRISTRVATSPFQSNSIICPVKLYSHSSWKMNVSYLRAADEG